MKTAPHFIVGLTVCFALGAGLLLAAEDRALFDPQHSMLSVLVEQVERAVSAPSPGTSRRGASAREAALGASRAEVPAARVSKP